MDLYDSIEKIIRQHEESLNVGQNANESDVRYAIRWVMRNNPDIFWFVHQYKIDKEQGLVTFRYQFSKDRSTVIQKSIDDVIYNDFQLDYARTLNTLEKVAYVYKWLLSYCNYNIHSAYNQNIDSVFVRRNSVCTGYAKAAQYLLQLLEIESRLVFGKLNNGREDGRHCWNIICIEGTYYHLDVCLGDVTLEDVLKNTGDSSSLRCGDYNYNYFCVSTAVISKTRTIESIDSLPPCNNNLPFDKVKRLSQIEIKQRANIKGCLLSHIGSSADIYLCSKNKGLVLKEFRNQNCAAEYEYMQMLKGCPHLLQVDDSYTNVESNYIAVEQSTPIVDLFCSHYYHPSLRSVLIMIKDITLGWYECYQRRVLYRDIHICNIYHSKNGIYKLGDFGSCTYKRGLRERVGNPWFMSPETYISGLFDERSAVYSITAVLYFVLNGLRPPFVRENDENKALVFKMNGEELPIPTLLHSFPDSIVKVIMERIIRRGCAYFPSNRIHSCKELIQEIDLLLNEFNNHLLELQFVQQDADPVLNNKYISDILISKDLYHRFTFGKDVEQEVISYTWSLNKSEKTTTNNEPIVLENYRTKEGKVLSDESQNETMNESDFSFDDFDFEQISDDAENYCRTMGEAIYPDETAIEEQEFINIDDNDCLSEEQVELDDSQYEIIDELDPSFDNFDFEQISDDVENYCRTMGEAIYPDKATSEKQIIPYNSRSVIIHETYINFKKVSSDQMSDNVENYCSSMEGECYPDKSTLNDSISFVPSPCIKTNETDSGESPLSSKEKTVVGGFGKITGSIGVFFRKLGERFGSLFSSHDKKPCKDNTLLFDVYSSIFAPAEVSPAFHMLVQVYLHLYEETEKVKVLAQESQKEAERRDYIPLQYRLMKGDKVDVTLNIYGDKLMMSDKKTVIWQGSFTKCSFDYYIPERINCHELSCIALLTVNNIPVGEMRFITKIVDTPRKLNTEIIAHKYNQVFISYSHLDESKVKFLHEGLELGGVPHFFDRHYLKTGDIFPQVIRNYINSADLFILCWSENAANSEYVQKERKQALKRAYPQVQPPQAAKLSIYPMSIEPHAELPNDMKEYYHFGKL